RDLEKVVDQLDVVGTRLERDLHEPVFSDVLGIDYEESLEIEQVTDTPAGAKVAAGGFEQPPQVAGRTVTIVSERLAKYGHTPGPITLVDHFLEILGAQRAGRLLDRPLDVILRHAERARLVDCIAEPHVRRRVATAGARGDVDRAAQLGKQF